MDKVEKQNALKKRLGFCDTIIVSAAEKNYNRIFLAEGKWYPVVLSRKRIEKIKYIAFYRTSPISAVTDICKVKKVVNYIYKDTEYLGGSKYVIEVELSSRIEVNIPVGADKNKAPQGPVYGVFDDIVKSKDLAEVFSLDKYLCK